MSEFENILLKKLTHNGEFFGKVMPILDSKHFTGIGNKELFKLIKAHYQEYSSIPELVELVAQVKNVPNETVRAEIVKTLQAVSATPEAPNVEFLCNETVKFIKDSLYLEALMIGSEGLQERNDEKKLKAQQILEERAKISIDSDLGLDFDDIDTMIEYYSTKQTGIRTQHKELNKRLGPGFIPGTLSLLLAASGVGKSLMMTDIISGVIKKNKNVLLISLEMADKEIMKRVHANAMDLPINSLIDLSRTEGELAKIRKGSDREPPREIVTKEQVITAYNKMKMDGNTGKLFIKDYPSGSFSGLMLEQLIESYKIEKNIVFDIVFVDYVGIMKSDRVSPNAGLYSYIKSIAEEVRAVAQKMLIPIISASQLNRGAIGNTDADNSAVSDSIGSVMTADFMLFLLQDEEMKERGEMILKCTKNRFNGRTDTWMMSVDYTRMRFEDMLVQGETTLESISDILMPTTDSLSDDFGIVTAKKQADAEAFAKNEVQAIISEDITKIKAADKKLEKDPFASDLEDIFKELNI